MMKLNMLLAAGLWLNLGSRLMAESTVPDFHFSLEYMDQSVKPEDDFFHYACGNWLKSNKIPQDRSTWGPTEALTEVNLKQLREICEKAAADKSAPEGLLQRRVGDYYTAASDEAKMNELGWKPIEADLKRVAAITDKAAYCALTADLAMRGIRSLLDWYVDADSKQSDRYAFHFYQGGLSMPERDYYLHDDFKKERAAFETHMEKMFTLAGDESAVAKKNAATVLRLQTALAKISKPAEELNDAVENYHKLTSAELEKLAPEFAWEAFWKTLGIKPESLVVAQPAFIAGAAKLLVSEPLEDWKTYLRWHVITTAAPSLHKAADDEDFAFFSGVLEGQKEQSPRWKRAVKEVDAGPSDLLGQLYVAEHFPPAAKARMEEMVKNIKAVYADHIRKAAWMSEATREKALAKLEKFRSKLGYPSKWKDYAGVEIKRDDHHGNSARLVLWETKRLLARVGKEVDREEWMMTAPTVNAYYNQNNNEIVFPAGILQPPFFDLSLDDAVNYGATGAVIGHEMTHGFDSEGRKYNGQGNLEDWWTEADAKEFDRRADVLVKGFSKMEAIPGLKVNGKLTLPENIADLGGVVLAYEGLQRAMVEDPKKREKIGGFTPEQRFFLSYSQSWVQLAHEAIIRKRVSSDPHAPDRLRAVAPLQNFQPFYEAFNIKPGSKMWIEPKNRAVIW